MLVSIYLNVFFLIFSENEVAMNIKEKLMKMSSMVEDLENKTKKSSDKSGEKKGLILIFYLFFI